MAQNDKVTNQWLYILSYIKRKLYKISFVKNREHSGEPWLFKIYFIEVENYCNFVFVYTHP